MARYDVQRIMFYDNGSPKSNESAVFAFTYWHGESQESSLFQCHVFRCDIPEAVSCNMHVIFHFSSNFYFVF